LHPYPRYPNLVKDLAVDFPDQTWAADITSHHVWRNIRSVVKGNNILRYNHFVISDRDNTQWLQDLRSEGIRKEAALSDLRALIINNLAYGLSSYLSPSDPRFEALAEETAQTTLLRVLDHLDSFEGRSRFTTWVYKISVRVALTELRRKRWENVSLDSLLEDEEHPPPVGLMEDPSPGPEAISEAEGIFSYVQQIMIEELTEKQRQALLAAAVHGMPLEEVARRMDTNRNALYKLLHDARLRLKNRLQRDGMSTEEILSVFEQT
jgi:RNA polymerase sigma-70 factor, ECF subfamily